MQLNKSQRGRSVRTPLPENVFMTLNFEPYLDNLITLSPPTVEKISVSFGANLFSGSGALEFTRFLWPSLADQ